MENIFYYKYFFHAGNLGANVTTQDLGQLFGLETTAYLRETCTVELATCEKTGKSKNFAFVTAPEHVHTELIKLNGIEFYGRQLVIEEAKSKTENEKENKENKEKKRGQNNRRGGRGGFRGKGRFGRPKSKFTKPTLEPDQVFHLVDCGVNLTNPK